MKLVVCVIMLAGLASADILQLERWPILESISRDNLAALFSQLSNAVFPDYREDFEVGFWKGAMQIKDYRITSLIPRYMFMKSTFFPTDHSTYMISLPLGFHITASFVWLFNGYFMPISGYATMDVDIYDFNYNTTLAYTAGNIDVKTSLTYITIPCSEVSVHGSTWVGAADMLLTMTKNYYPLMQSYINSTFASVLPTSLVSHIPKNIAVSLYYPTFHFVFAFNLPLQGVTNRDALMLTYGKAKELPDAVTAGEKVSRQYCVDPELLNTIVAGVWPKIKGIYRKGDLPKRSVYELTVTGLGQLVPDVPMKYSHDAEVTLTLTAPDKAEDPDIKLVKINETHGLAKGLRMMLTYDVNSEVVLKVTLRFDVTVTPISERRDNGYTFNLKTIEAAVEKDTMQIVSPYKTMIMSNIYASSSEFLTYLILPFLGNTLLGDGILLNDDITAHSVAEYSVATSAICLNLIKFD